jgi:thiol-disulfide isomerase/thioredoxin
MSRKARLAIFLTSLLSALPFASCTERKEVDGDSTPVVEKEREASSDDGAKGILDPESVEDEEGARDDRGNVVEPEPRRDGPREVVFEDSGRKRRFLDEMQGKPPRPLFCSSWIPPVPFDLEESRGQVVLLFFWGSWCKACQRMMPLVKQWHERYTDRGLVILGIHSTRDGERAEAYVRDHDIPFRVGVDFEQSNEKRFHVDSFPDFYLVDRKGILRFADISNAREQYVVDAIEMLLEEDVSREEVGSAPGAAAVDQDDR